MTYNDKVLTYSPIAFWPINEGSGPTVDNLEGTAARDGTASAGVSFGETGIGDGETSVEFDGTDSINIDTASLEGAFDGSVGSLHVWVKVTTSSTWTDSAHGYIFRLYGSAADFMQVYEASDGNLLIFEYQAGSTYKQVQVTKSDTNWLSLGMSWSDSGNADQFKVYVNGSQAGSTLTGLGAWTATTFVVATIGNVYVGASSPWLGYIAKPAVFDSVLSDADFAELATIPAAGNPYYAYAQQ